MRLLYIEWVSDVSGLNDYTGHNKTFTIALVECLHIHDYY